MANQPDPSGFRFLVALSFPGERNDPFVAAVARILEQRLSRQSVFYYPARQTELNVPDMESELHLIFKEQSLLCVPFFCKEYAEKQWCLREWKAIRAGYFVHQYRPRLQVFRFDRTPIDLHDEIDGYEEIGKKLPQAIADSILLRIEALTGRSVGTILTSSTAQCVDNLPFPSIHGLFKGREEELKKLEAAHGPAAIVQPKAIHGLGGIGKTRLAAELGWRAVADDHTTAVLFVTAETPQRLQTGLAGLTEALNLPQLETTDERAQTQAVLAWLATHQDWFLILDNADTPEAMQAVKALLQYLARGRVLITSRRHGWGAGVQTVDLAVMPEDKAVEFLLERTQNRPPTDHDDADARRICRELECLPLALELAGAYVDAQGCTLADYLKSWETNRETALNWRDATDPTIPLPIAMTWNRTIDVLTPAALALLRLAAHLAPEPIPIALFERQKEHFAKAVGLLAGKGAQKGKKKEKKEPDADPMQALGELASYSLVRREAETFQVHRLVQEVVRFGIPKNRRRVWLEGCLNLIDADCSADPPPQDVRSWSWWEPMRPHVGAIVDHADGDSIAEPTARLMNELALYLRARAIFDQAEPLMRRALAIDEGSYGPDHPDVAIDLNNLASLLRATNRLGEAEPPMRRALAIDEAS